MTNTIPVAVAALAWTEPWAGPPAPHLLRGAVAAAFPGNDLFHQHTADGSPIFRYPRIHYRWDTKSGDGVIAGFGDGVEALAELFLNDMQLRLGDRVMTVREAQVLFSRCEVRMVPNLMRYRFRSPWLPLNQENYERYRIMSGAEQTAELDRLAVGNILSALKGFDIRVAECVYTAFLPRRKIWCGYKNQQLLGFLGTLVTNVALPDGFALGKAVSHGYGWMEDY